MRTEPEGPGWWMASDGRWYPPELHPAVLSGDRTPDELRSAPLSGRSDRTTIRWVADAEPTTAAEPVATLQADPGSTIEVAEPSGPDLAVRDDRAIQDDLAAGDELATADERSFGQDPAGGDRAAGIVLVDREPATIDLRAPGDEPPTDLGPPPSKETDRVRGAVAAEGGPEYELPPDRQR